MPRARAYRWLCGGVPVDYHLLSDFRREHQEALNDLLTQIVATLMAQDLVTDRSKPLSQWPWRVA